MFSKFQPKNRENRSRGVQNMIITVNISLTFFKECLALGVLETTSKKRSPSVSKHWNREQIMQILDVWTALGRAIAVSADKHAPLSRSRRALRGSSSAWPRQRSAMSTLITHLCRVLDNAMLLLIATGRQQHASPVVLRFTTAWGKLCCVGV